MKMKYYFIVAAIALLAVFVAVPVGAGNQDRRLFGDYTYNIAATCVHAVCGQLDGKFDCQSPSTRGFDPVTLALREPGTQKSYSYNIQSVIQFDGRGKFTLNGEGLVIRSSLGTNLPDIPANRFGLDCDGTYTVDSVGNEQFVDITFEGCTATIKSGLFGLLGFTQNISGPITARGRLDAGTGSSPVIISNTIPYIEELEVTAALEPLTSLIGSKEQRICNNMGSMEKLSPLK
jgi:hypothetical protein